MAGTGVTAAIETGAYRLERAALNGLSPSICREWVALLERHGCGSPMHDPRSLAEAAVHESRPGIVCLLYRRGGELAGVAPFQLRDWPLRWQVGELTLARLPLHRLCLLGGSTWLPDDPAACDLIFQGLDTASYGADALYLEDVAIDSFVWKFFEKNAGATIPFLRYVPSPPAPRVLLRLEGSFEEYTQHFTAKHRKNLKRLVRLFEEQAPGETRTIRITTPEDVPSFVAQAVEISRKTYQWNLLGLGLRSPEALAARLSFMARQGWLRSYLLTSRGVPCAFVIGFQYGLTYHLDDMGHDPAYRDYSVGKVLHYELIRDLFSYRPPRLYDMGEYGPHKEEFGNATYLQGSFFLFRPTLYRRVVFRGHSTFSSVTAAVSGVAERFGLKKRLKKLIRLWSSRQ